MGAWGAEPALLPLSACGVAVRALFRLYIYMRTTRGSHHLLFPVVTDNGSVGCLHRCLAFGLTAHVRTRVLVCVRRRSRSQVVAYTPTLSIDIVTK